MEKERKLTLGVNYWPGDKGIYWWREFELTRVNRDFSLAAEYGLDLIRIFLLWEDFQPEINRVSVPALEDMVRVADLAQDRRIKILPTFFCGHMRGVKGRGGILYSPWAKFGRGRLGTRIRTGRCGRPRNS
jgi:endo-1,4-beta-mannosidase